MINPKVGQRVEVINGFGGGVIEDIEIYRAGNGRMSGRPSGRVGIRLDNPEFFNGNVAYFWRREYTIKRASHKMTE
jgi:hypothetical protein